MVISVCGATTPTVSSAAPLQGVRLLPAVAGLGGSLGPGQELGQMWVAPAAPPAALLLLAASAPSASIAAFLSFLIAHLSLLALDRVAGPGPSSLVPAVPLVAAPFVFYPSPAAAPSFLLLGPLAVPVDAASLPAQVALAVSDAVLGAVPPPVSLVAVFVPDAVPEAAVPASVTLRAAFLPDVFPDAVPASVTLAAAVPGAVPAAVASGAVAHSLAQVPPSQELCASPHVPRGPSLAAQRTPSGMGQAVKLAVSLAPAGYQWEEKQA